MTAVLAKPEGSPIYAGVTGRRRLKIDRRGQQKVTQPYRAPHYQWVWGIASATANAVGVDIDASGGAMSDSCSGGHRATPSQRSNPTPRRGLKGNYFPNASWNAIARSISSNGRPVSAARMILPGAGSVSGCWRTTSGCSASGSSAPPLPCSTAWGNVIRVPPPHCTGLLAACVDYSFDSARRTDVATVGSVMIPRDSSPESIQKDRTTDVPSASRNLIKYLSPS